MEFEPSPASLAAGQRVYAIGDVHGCADRLAMMHGAIAEDLAARPVLHALVIHIGDYIDRGPDSAGVIERLLEPFPSVPGGPRPQIVNLIGNHEEMLLTALEDGDRRSAELWLANGGGETLASWGLSWRSGPPGLARARSRHVISAFLRGLALVYRAGGYLFVHAGAAARSCTGTAATRGFAVDSRTLPLLDRETAGGGGARPHAGRIRRRSGRTGSASTPARCWAGR